MINLLRTNQVRAAQKGIPTGSVYKCNERNLASVGVGQLDNMLKSCDWDGLYGRGYEQHGEELQRMDGVRKSTFGLEDNNAGYDNKAGYDNNASKSSQA